MTDELAWIRRTDPLAARFQEILARPGLDQARRPVDLARHRERFLADWRADKPRDPVFAYAPCDPAVFDDLADLRARASRFDDPWHRLLAEEVGACADRLRAVLGRDPQYVTAAAVADNGLPDADLLADARRILAAEPLGGGGRRPPQRPRLDASAVAGVFTAVLGDLGLDAWSVRLDPGMAAGMAVSTARREVMVRPDVELPRDALQRLAAHEIGTHVLRWDNARRAPRLLSLTLTGHTATEEGFAAWHERLAVPGAAQNRRALRVLGVDAARRGGFVEVVREMQAYTTLPMAFEMAARAKGGLVETAAPGGYLRDHVYLSGLRAVTRHLEAAPGDYPLLMSTKWPLHRIGLLAHVGLPLPEQQPLAIVDGAFLETVRARIDAAVEAAPAAARRDPPR